MAKTKKEKDICGIVMPISAIDGCDESHWSEVQNILTEGIEAVGYEANLVSNADDVGVIHKRIIQNLYDNPIVVCDISGKNANVMFELGMRLAFDKPTIIVKDDETSYSFDTSAIEHIEYPRDLRFARIVEFKDKLGSKIQATMEKFNSDPENSTFLKHFGEFKVAKIDKKEVSGQEFILEEMKAMRAEIRSLSKPSSRRAPWRTQRHISRDVNICLRSYSEKSIAGMMERAGLHESVTNAEFIEFGKDHRHLVADLVDSADRVAVKNEIRKGGEKKPVQAESE